MAQIVCPCEGAASTNTLHALYVTEYTAIACMEAEGPALKNASDHLERLGSVDHSIILWLHSGPRPWPSSSCLP